MATDKPTPVKMTTGEMRIALRAKYPEKEYSMFEEVAEDPGGQCRRVDMIVVNLWKSRGHYITGFELKQSRSDWLSEMRNPSKAEAIAKYCNFWYLVVGNAKIVKDGELPEGWGLMVPHGNGRLKIAKEAPKLSPVPVDISFFTSLCRSAKYAAPEDEINAAYLRGRKEGREKGQELMRPEIDRANRRRDEIQKYIEEFEAKSGLRLNNWRAGNLGEIVHFLLAGGAEGIENKLHDLRQTAQQLIKNLDHALPAVEEFEKKRTFGHLPTKFN